MPLHGKIVVIKRSGGDGTEFPLTASCLFGRKPDCDIRIQLPQVSKEHCKIDLNENKEVILTNLSSVNPTLVNGEALQQSERLKHGDVITIIDRSFRFEYPPAPTPKKRLSTGGKTETLKVLHDQTAADTVNTEGDKRISAVSTGPHLKDGTNHDNIQRSLEKTMELESKEEVGTMQNKTASPFNDLYQMIKKSLDVKTPRKSSVSLLQTPSSRFCSPKPVSVKRNDAISVTAMEDKSTLKKNETKASSGAAETNSNGTPKSVKKQRKSFQGPSNDMPSPKAKDTVQSESTSPQKRGKSRTSQQFTVCEVNEQTSSQTPRRSSTEAKLVVTSPETQRLPKSSPRNSGKVETVKETSRKRKHGELAADLPAPQIKRKRVSFGSHLSPELFDKRLPPDSPLRKGATPRRSLSLYKPKQSLLRRASVIGLIQEQTDNVQSPAKMRTPSPKNVNIKKASPKSRSPSPKVETPGKKSPKSRSPSPKVETPGKKSPKSRSPSPKVETPGKKSLKSRSPSPKVETPGKKSPKSRSPSPKVETPGKKSPKSRSPSPKVDTPGKKSPKSRSASPKVETPGKQSPKSRSPSPKVETPGKKSPKSRSASPKVETPGKKSPKSRSPSPKVDTPGKKSPKSRSASPKVDTPGKKSPKSRSASPKVDTPGKKSPKSRSPSPKVDTPGKKSPKSRSASPKVETPGKKSPKSRSPSPKVETPGKKSPKSRSPSPKVETPGKKSPKSRNPSPATGRSPSRNKVETLGFQTPTVRGRFSVSRISTPSPTAVCTAADKMHSEAVTPKLPLRRKSMKSTSQKSVLKSTVKVMSRRSGVSRASMKVTNSWANIVKFGQKKAQVGGPVKPKVTKKTVKKTVSKLQTPARKVKGHVSTGHADSPVTIVVGRAHKRMAVHPTVAAPKSVISAAFLKKHMNTDEDLTGISEMYKTPVLEKKRSVIDSSAMKTPVGGLGTSVVEPSVLNTPEEPGEMIVSPLSTAKDTRYNSEAVQRLLSDEESSFNCDIPLMEADDSREHCTDLKISVTTPRQKPELPDCLTGVKRIMKTPRQKTEPVEDLRGNLLKTPKQKPEQLECLTGVKRIMKTPRQQTEPVEDLRGNLLKTPKQKPEQLECLTGVKRIMKTPRQQTEPVEDLRDKILKTPKQKLEPQECLTGVKRIFSTPQEEVKLLEDLQRKPLESPAAGSSDCVAEVVTAADLSGIRSMNTPQAKKSPPECLTGIKRMMKTPRHRYVPVEDMVGLKRLMKTPREKSQPVHENFGIKRLMKSPRLRGIEPVEDFEGLKELIEEPVPESTGQQEITEAEDHTLDRALDITNEADEKEAAVDHTDGVPLRKDESSDDRPTVSQTADLDSASGKPEEMSKPKTVVRGRRARMVDAEPTEDKQKATENSEETVISAPVKGRRGMKTGAVAPSAVRQTRGRTAKTTEIKGVKVSAEQRTAVTSKVAIQSKIGRHARKASDQSETVQEVNAEAETVPQPESEEALSLNVSPKAGDKTAAGVKAKRRGKPKQPDQLLPPTNDVSQAEKEAESNEVSCDPLTVMPTWINENPSDNMECARQASVTQSALEEKADAGHITETDTAIVQKKSSRGRRAKLESKTAEEVPEQSGDPLIAPVRGRRGRKAATAAPPAVRQMRNRNAKSHECSANEHEMPPEKDETPLSEITTEAESDQNLILNAEKADMKPIRGRKLKQTPAKPSQPEPKNDEVVNEEHPTEDEQPQKPILALGKPRRGRKTKMDNEQSEVSVATVDTEQQVVPLVRAKRGRSARQEETNEENETKTLKPITKLRRTRKAEQDHVEPSQVQHNQVGISKDVEAPVIAEPIMTDHMDMDSKPRRGGRTAKREHENEKPADSKSDDVQEIAAASETDKPKRGRRARHITAEVTAVVPGGKADSELEAEEKNMKLVQAKATRAKGVKKEESVAVPAKRTRRAAVDSLVESTDLVSGLASSSAEPPKRGRRAAARPPADAAIQTSDQANISEGSNVVVEDTKISKRSVKWKTDVEVFEIQKVTPVKAVRGTKSKRGHVDPESQNMLKDASKTEEKDLSETTEAQPARRARRGTTDTDKSTSKLQKVETEPPLKTRRGRSAKK